MYENIAVARINKAVNGIELTFPSGKPAYEVLKALKENGFRWHNKKQLWYGRNTAEHVQAVEKYVDLAASDPSFGVTPNGTVDVQEVRRQRVGSDGLVYSDALHRGDEIVAESSDTNKENGSAEFVSDKLNVNMKDWYLAKYPEDGGARLLDWRGVGTFRELFDSLDLQMDIYDAYPGDSVVRERLFSGLAEILGCDYNAIYKQWLGSEETVGGLRKAVEGKYDLGFGHKGNGIVVWNRMQEEHGDYKSVAHISADRVVTYYDKNVPESVKQKIRDFAECSDLTISATQDKKVFKNPPVQRVTEISAEMAPGNVDTKKEAVLVGRNDNVGLNTRMREWYEKTYSHDNSAVELLWDNNATFLDLFNRLDSFLNIYAMIPRDSVVRERLFSQLADTLGCNYDMIYNQWDNGEPGALTRFKEGKKKETEQSQVGQGKRAVKADCLADFYDKIGTSGEIYRDSTVEGALWSPAWGKCYYADLNVCISVKLDSARVVDLENAMKRGKTCKVYSITSGGQDMRLYLANECGVRTPKDLYDLVRSGRELTGGGRIRSWEEKGVETFSPFISVKPLKELPEKWKKTDLVRAIMAGQVYSGTWKERLTDDYAYDAAGKFWDGRKVDLPAQAEDLVEDCRDPYIKTESVDSKGIATVYYSYCNETKKFQFDVNCDLGQSLERQQAMDRAVQEHNEQIKASILKLSASDIDDGKVYVVDRVAEDENTGRLGVAPEVLQGFILKDLLDFGGTVGGITGVKEAELVPGRLYSVADFFQRRDYAEPDTRVVDMGNWKQLASGKAVQELTQEGVRLKMSIGGYEKPISFEAAKKTCLEHLNGTRYWGPGVQKVDYAQSLEKLEYEQDRVMEQREPQSLMDAISAAEHEKLHGQRDNGSRAVLQFPERSGR